MKLKADSLNIMQDILNGGFQLSLHVNEIPTGADALRDGPLAVSITKWRERRTLTANAYYWVLVGKIGEATELSNQVVHNMLLRRYGVPDLTTGDLLTTIIPVDAEEEILKKEFFHVKPTTHIKEGKDGKLFRVYIILKGSSEMDSKEFSRLVDGAVSEAKELGLETLPKEELERMKEDYEKHYSNRC